MIFTRKTPNRMTLKRMNYSPKQIASTEKKTECYLNDTKKHD
jgi:hypothetical protein